MKGNNIRIEGDTSIDKWRQRRSCQKALLSLFLAVTVDQEPLESYRRNQPQFLPLQWIELQDTSFST